MSELSKIFITEYRTHHSVTMADVVAHANDTEQAKRYIRAWCTSNNHPVPKKVLHYKLDGSVTEIAL